MWWPLWFLGLDAQSLAQGTKKQPITYQTCGVERHRTGGARRMSRKVPLTEANLRSLSESEDDERASGLKPLFSLQFLEDQLPLQNPFWGDVIMTSWCRMFFLHLQRPFIQGNQSFKRKTDFRNIMEYLYFLDKNAARKRKSRLRSWWFYSFVVSVRLKEWMQVCFLRWTMLYKKIWVCDSRIFQSWPLRKQLHKHWLHQSGECWQIGEL